MVRTGARAAVLALMLSRLGRSVSSEKPPAPRLDALPAHTRFEIQSLYAAMGGVKERELRPGAWDLALADGSVVELDEEFHFTRYRGLTLALSFELELPWTPEYRTYCERFESIAGGGRWASPSTIAMFGGADEVGVFDEHGSPRGKQRAIYDSMKDAAAASGAVALTRLSIHDQVGDATLDQVLRGRRPLDLDALLALIEAREVR